MKLYEFFGHINVDDLVKNKDHQTSVDDHEQEVDLEEELFNFILDDDDLHKKFFMPIAKNIKRSATDGDPKTDSHDWKLWISMVNAGCMKYYKEHDIKKHPKDAFPKDLRKDLCKRLTDHYHEDIMKNAYKLGN